MRKRWIRWGVLLVSLIVLLVILWQIGASGVLDAMIGMDPRYVVLALLCYFGVHLAWGIKWYLLVKKRVKNAYFPFVFLANVTGNFINVTTPSGRMAGEPVRAGAVAKRFRAPFPDVFATAMVDKMGLTMAMLLLLFPLIIFAYGKFEMDPILKYFLWAFFLFWVMVAVLSYAVFHSMTREKAERMGTWIHQVTAFIHRDKLWSRETLVGKVGQGLTGFKESFKMLARDPVTLIVDVFLGMLTYLFRFFAAYMFFIAIGYPQEIYIVATAVHISFIIGLISQLPGMFVIAETTMTVLYGAMGVRPTAALTVSILTQLNSYLFELGFGYLAMIALNIYYDIDKMRSKKKVTR